MSKHCRQPGPTFVFTCDDGRAHKTCQLSSHLRRLDGVRRHEAVLFRFRVVVVHAAQRRRRWWCWRRRNGRCWRRRDGAFQQFGLPPTLLVVLVPLGRHLVQQRLRFGVLLAQAVECTRLHLHLSAQLVIVAPQAHIFGGNARNGNHQIVEAHLLHRPAAADRQAQRRRHAFFSTPWQE